MTVEDLRKNGYKVRVIHSRYYNRCVYYDDSPQLLNKRELEKDNQEALPSECMTSMDILARGGRTVVDITCPDSTELRGVSECSVDENYNRKKGVAIAIVRALTGSSHSNDLWSLSFIEVIHPKQFIEGLKGGAK